MKNTLRKSSLATAVAALTGLSCSAFAALEEVIVTAEKREESIQDVPISIVAFSNDRLEKLGITDVKGLAAKVPNVLINEFTGSSTNLVHGLGIALVVARILHPLGLRLEAGPTVPRVIGTAVTWGVLIVGAIVAIIGFLSGGASS